jgi:hypothetical protein
MMNSIQFVNVPCEPYIHEYYVLMNSFQAFCELGDCGKGSVRCQKSMIENPCKRKSTHYQSNLCHTTMNNNLYDCLEKGYLPTYCRPKFLITYPSFLSESPLVQFYPLLRKSNNYEYKCINPTPT